MYNPIALIFGTWEKAYRACLGIKFTWNSSIGGWVIGEYSWKMTPICCHAYRVNSLHYEAENQYMDCLNVEPQTFFCGLVEIKEIVTEW